MAVGDPIRDYAGVWRDGVSTGRWYETEGEGNGITLQFVPDAGTPLALERDRQAKVAAHIARLREILGALFNAYQSWETLTNAQKDATLKLNVEATGRLARVVANSLEE